MCFQSSLSSSTHLGLFRLIFKSSTIQQTSSGHLDKATEQVNVVAILQIFIQEIPTSNLGQCTGYPVREYYPLLCDTVQSGRRPQIFRRNLLLNSAVSKAKLNNQGLSSYWLLTLFNLQI
jgi:hypothetical protein